MTIFSDLLGGLIKPITGLIDDLTTTDEEKLAAKAKLLAIQGEFTSKVLEYEARIASEQGQTIRTEAASSHWLAANWRPIIMLLFGFIILNNYVLAQYFSLPSLEIPPDMWGLIKIGLGGYVFGRSAEKIVPSTIAALKAKEVA